MFLLVVELLLFFFVCRFVITKFTLDSILFWHYVFSAAKFCFVLTLFILKQTWPRQPSKFSPSFSRKGVTDQELQMRSKRRLLRSSMWLIVWGGCLSSSVSETNKRFIQSNVYVYEPTNKMFTIFLTDIVLRSCLLTILVTHAKNTSYFISLPNLFFSFRFNLLK